MKKKIRIKICGFNGENTPSYGFFLVGILSRYYDVELSEYPDYLFYHESTFDHLQYDCIKIFYTGENISPNFNMCDYAIGFDYLNFEDRYYRLPLYQVAVFYNSKETEIAGDDYLNRQALFTKEDLSRKTDFCSFVYSNYRAEEERKIIFDKLSEYKKVSAGGGYLNNVGERIDNKLEFEMKHKFSIAFENSSRSGYTTEKIVSSLVAKTIPIYWGNPKIGKEFNTRRFINCHDYVSFEEVVGRVAEIDGNDELYLKIINEPIAANGYNFDEVKNGVDLFLRNIMDQPVEKARRRTINSVRAMGLIKNEIIIAKHIKRRNILLKILAPIYNTLRRIKIFEQLKYKYLKNELKRKVIIK